MKFIAKTTMKLFIPIIPVSLLILAGYHSIEYAGNLLTFITFVLFVLLTLAVFSEKESNKNASRFWPGYNAVGYLFVAVGCAWYGWFFLATVWLLAVIYIVPVKRSAQTTEIVND